MTRPGSRGSIRALRLALNSAGCTEALDDTQAISGEQTGLLDRLES